jgi:hypothetical protein
MSTPAANIPLISPSAQNQSSPRGARSRRRRWLKVLVATGIIVVFVAAAAPTIIAKTALRNRIARLVAADLNGSIEIGAASLGWFSSIELRDVTLTDSRGRALARIPKVTSSRTLIGLLRNRATLGELVLDRPILEVVCEPGTTNLEEVFRSYLEDEGAPRGPTRPELSIRVQSGTLVLRDVETGATGEIRDVDAAISVPSARTEPVAVKMNASAPGRIEAEMALGESGSVRLRAERFATESLVPLKRRFSVDLAIAGALSADVTASWGKDSAQVEGKVGARSLDLSGDWLNGETLRLNSFELPVKAAINGRVVRIDRAELTSDIGSITAAGSFDLHESFDELLQRSGTKLDATIDLAKLARVLPRSMRVRDRTEIHEGKLVLKVESRSGPDGTEWTGKIDTSAIGARRDGIELRWDDPLAIEFAGRYRPGKLPTFDRLICRSDFIALQAEVRPDSIRAAANIHLDKLTERLKEFIDLEGTTFDGRGEATLVAQRAPDGSFKGEATLNLKQFAFTDRTGNGLMEPQISLRFSATGRAPDSGAISVSTGRATLTAGQDELDLTIIEPIADVRELASGNVDAKLRGELGRWWKRVGALVRLPKHYVLGGETTARGRIRFDRDRIHVDELALKLTNAQFRGAGLDLDEPQMDGAADLTIDTQSMTAAFERFTVNSAPLSVSNGRLSIHAPDMGPVVVEGSGPVVVGLGRLGKTLRLFADPRGPNSMHGRGSGPIRFRYGGDVTTFAGSLDVASFSVGLPSAPDWTEPTLRLETEGSYTESTDTLALTSAKIERPGFALVATGALGKVGKSADMDLNGTLTYDLAKLTPKLREQLGGNFAAQGRGAAPVALSGSLSPVTKPLAKQRSGSLAGMNGEVRLSWESLRAYGFDVGRSELHGKLASGVGRVSPIVATFGGGRVTVQPTVRFDVEPGFLSLGKGKLVERAKLTPAVCAEAIGYALPAIAKSGKAEGEISIALDENRIPFADSTQALVKGQITIHRATAAPGPVVGEIAKLLGAGNLAMTVTNDTVVPIRVENGSVHHQNFSVQIGGHTISTSGSVGFDGKLNLVADVPIPAGLLKGSPLAAKTLANRRVKVPITGTLSQPMLDPRQFQASIAKLAQEAMKDLGKELLNKDLDRLFPTMPRPKK